MGGGLDDDAHARVGVELVGVVFGGDEGGASCVVVDDVGGGEGIEYGSGEFVDVGFDGVDTFAVGVSVSGALGWGESEVEVDGEGAGDAAACCLGGERGLQGVAPGFESFVGFDESGAAAVSDCCLGALGDWGSCDEEG